MAALSNGPLLRLPTSANTPASGRATTGRKRSQTPETETIQLPIQVIQPIVQQALQYQQQHQHQQIPQAVQFLNYPPASSYPAVAAAPVSAPNLVFLPGGLPQLTSGGGFGAAGLQASQLAAFTQQLPPPTSSYSSTASGATFTLGRATRAAPLSQPPPAPANAQSQAVPRSSQDEDDVPIVSADSI